MPASSIIRTYRDLETEAADLVKRLGGIWTPGGGMCRCPAHNDRTPSLSVRVGEKALLFKCFAGCETIDVMRAIRRLDMSIPTGGERLFGSPSSPLSPSWLRRRAQNLWDDALPIAGTPAQTYLRRRAIPLTPSVLRYHPRTPLGRGKLAAFRPAMLAAIHEHDRLVALQRTFPDTQEPCRARDLANPRRSLAQPGRGAVLLAPATQVLGLAEGVESALSAMFLLGIPVWATLGSERFPQVAAPETVTRLILLPDSDRAGRIGAAKGSEVHALPGRTIETIWPPAPFNDWNDVLRARRKGVGKGTRQAA
ncbi:MAG: toprim domain-containing protein [Novosphingobium sp.]